MSRLNTFLKKRSARRSSTRRRRPARFVSSFESLEPRLMLSVTAVFSPQGVLTVDGDQMDNTIVVSRDSTGNILVNGGATPIGGRGGIPTVANTSLIEVLGRSGNDTITLDQTNGALPQANLSGNAGDDTLTGGAGNDTLDGGSGNDTLEGRGGSDILRGGAGDDILTGGDSDDQVFGEAGNDRMIWNPGDDTDLNEGDSGIDTVEVNGGNGAENFMITTNGSRVSFDRVNPAPFSLDIGTTENLVLNAQGGDDVVDASGLEAGVLSLELNGGFGADVLIGSQGNDLVNGGDGDDVALLGAGDDTFVWNPGDDNDTVEGQAGTDTLLFNGANVDENIDISANGGRVLFFRNVANVTMDLNDVEQIDFNALGGADNIVVSDLSGTDATEINLNLARRR